eukprot:TRINITY_DN9914_c0_g2_i1.p1 TRINITY_DN9914_c0_g2~~TRINITY_DN9914_c0_g2_i1.p1  ORF type:complete len:214 (+),score=70.62 TRINITY_DN9914_c0_g2_i1:134-775(+)
MEFSATNNFQFLLFMAYFYLKFDTEIMYSMILFLEAFKHIGSVKTYHSCFPINTFKQLGRKLSLEELRKLLIIKSELALVIKELYKEKAAFSKSDEEADSKQSIGWPSPAPKGKDNMLLKLARMAKSSAASTFSTTPSSSPKPVHFLNTFKKIPAVVNNCPNSVVYYALKDLLQLLRLYKFMGKKVFAEVGKSSSFKVILQQAAVLRVSSSKI